MKATVSLPVTSATSGSSSSKSSTRLPAANVFCSVLPSPARATVGPKEDISASTAVSAPSKGIVPFWHRRDAVKSISRSNIKMTQPLSTLQRPDTRFMRSSSALRASVCACISFMRA